MHRDVFSHVDTWVFDLDNTLYHPSARLFEAMNPLMTRYVMRVAGVAEEVADRLRVDYWRDHGSTLAGLMARHAVDPADFLARVHEIDLSHLPRAPELDTALRALPGRRIVYTNGSSDHAKRVLAARGLTRAFDAVFSIEDAGFLPKPQAEAFARVFARAGVTPRSAAMFEDEARNLAVPHDLGMATVHVHDRPEVAAYIHHGTDDLHGFLTELAS